MGEAVNQSRNRFQESITCIRWQRHTALLQRHSG